MQNRLVPPIISPGGGGGGGGSRVLSGTHYDVAIERRNHLLASKNKGKNGPRLFAVVRMPPFDAPTPSAIDKGPVTL